MLLHIKNMVCDRCIMAVRQQLENLNFHLSNISLGTAEVLPDPDDKQLQNIASALKVLGFELIDKEKDKLVDRIKTVLIELIHYADLSDLRVSLISILADKMNRDYAYLSRLFSDNQDLTIEKFIIQQKIEKVKELLEYGELNLNEIAFKMGYSSSAHLSAQFKTITGITPSKFKSDANQKRQPIDKL